MDWMHSRLRVLAAAVGLLLIAALAFTATPARAATNRPASASGDFWVYAYSSALTGTSISGTLRMDVTGTESVSVNGSSYSTYHVAATLTIPFGSLTFNLPATIWYSTDTLAIVKIVAAVNLAFGTVSANSHVSISGNPPQIIQWPLTAGASWDSSTTVWDVTTNSTGAVRYTQMPLATHFEVQTDASITVPAGTFTTSPLKETAAGSTSFVINYWSPQAGNSVRTESHNSSGQSAGPSCPRARTSAEASTVGTLGLPSRGRGPPSRRARCPGPCSRRVRKAPWACSSPASSPCRCPRRSRLPPGAD